MLIVVHFLFWAYASIPVLANIYPWNFAVFFVKARVQGQSFGGRSWEDLFDLALGWVIASDLADATKISSNARWMEVFGILGHFPFPSPIYVTSISGQTCSSTNVEILS